MNFAQVKGNDRLVEVLRSMVDSGRIPHAMLFEEEDGGEAFAICLALLRYLYCRKPVGGDSCSGCPSCSKIDKLIHPDVHLVFPTASSSYTDQYLPKLRALLTTHLPFREADVAEALGLEGKKQMIAVSEARHLLESLSLSALEGGYRSVIVYLPEKMNAETANKLLKIIEEPPEKTLFLMITHRPEMVLQTISSRCRHFSVGSVREEELLPSFDSPELFDGLMDALCSHNLGAALDVADRLSALPSRDSAKAFCKFAAARLRHIFVIRQGLPLSVPRSPELERWAAQCKGTFPRRALAVLDKASRMLDLNANVKILFADVVCKLYTQV